MRVIVGFLRFWWDFVVGDDPTGAATVVVALALTALLAHFAGAWVILPLAVLLFLALSLWRVTRR